MIESRRSTLGVQRETLAAERAPAEDEVLSVVAEVEVQVRERHLYFSKSIRINLLLLRYICCSCACAFASATTLSIFTAMTPTDSGLLLWRCLGSYCGSV